MKENNNEIKWSGTAFELPITEENRRNIEKLKKECEKHNVELEMDEEETSFVIYNNKRLFFKEEEYIEQTYYFFGVLLKLHRKDFSQDIYYVEDDYSLTPIKNKDYESYFKTIQMNNISGIEKGYLSISLEALNQLKKKSEKIKSVISLYTLIYLFNRTVYKDGEFIFSKFYDDPNPYVIHNFDDKDILENMKTLYPFHIMLNI